MRVTSFCIKNFRSIHDTGWHNFASDNITCLIGQNESGKSSILEGLNSFYTGVVTSDDLRSDGTHPEISCSFDIELNALKEIVGAVELPDDFWDTFSKVYKGRINIIRVWTDQKTSTLTLQEKKLSDLFLPPTRTKPKEVPKEPLVPVEEPALSEAPTPESPALPAKPLISTASQFAELVFKQIPTFALFEDFSSLLPNQIDFEDIQNSNAQAEGYKGAKNLFSVLDISLEDLKSAEKRIRENKIGNLNKTLTLDFQEFWQQKIGKSNRIGIELDLSYHDDSVPEKAGKPYFSFWVNDGQEKLYPKQRSKGVRWFLSFYLQLKASKKEAGERNSILLIDEPGGSLHAKAQEDLLKVLEDINDKVQVVYTTHSPHLVKLATLYRLLAIQRADVDDTMSDTQVIDIHKLGSASVDTLLPVYTLMGSDASYQNVVQKTGNVILEEVSAYYYLRAFWHLYNKPENKIHFLPATGNNNVLLLCNLFLGWGLSFGAVVDGDPSGVKIYEKLKDTLYGGDESLAQEHVHVIKECSGIEDILSQIDFKKHILKDESLIYTELNSAKVKGKGKAVYALQFMHEVENDKIKLADLDSDTKEKAKKLVESIEKLKLK